MLDQYRQDLNSDNDHLGEGRFQMSRRKVVLTLATAAIALLFFLFIVGAFRSEDDVAADKETTTAVASELVDLQARVEKLEQMVQGSPVLASRAATQEVNSTPLNDNTLKQLIASNAMDDQIINEPDAPEAGSDASTPPVAQPQTQIAQAAPVVKAAAPKMYTIQKGDTLSKISQKFYGTTKKWKSIYDANRDRINNINNLKVGSQIVIPEDAAK
ncbi:MAG: LysM peptidoglycan-binding domain-containing protein [Chlamydiales bacterium]|nr:LysM peptidoglycan-binding domain-containing protein [Chlamydiales bacterium]